MSSDLKTILVVDDAPDNIRLISGILHGQFKTKAAISGIKALLIAQKSPQPSLILLDIMMPEMDGYEVCRRLKSDPVTENIPVIFITGNSSDEEREKGMGLGAVDYFIKPLEPNTALETIARYAL